MSYKNYLTKPGRYSTNKDGGLSKLRMVIADTLTQSASSIFGDAEFDVDPILINTAAYNRAYARWVKWRGGSN